MCRPCLSDKPCPSARARVSAELRIHAPLQRLCHPVVGPSESWSGPVFRVRWSVEGDRQHTDPPDCATIVGRGARGGAHSLSRKGPRAVSWQTGCQVISPCRLTRFPLSGQAYERGISLFKWPNVSDIWSTYLTKFIARYGGRKLERARDLFEQALDGCPPKYAKSEGQEARGRVVGRGGVSWGRLLTSDPLLSCQSPVPAVCTAGGGMGPGPARHGRVRAGHPRCGACPAV